MFTASIEEEKRRKQAIEFKVIAVDHNIILFYTLLELYVPARVVARV
jgi:hypothetical protein